MNRTYIQMYMRSKNPSLIRYAWDHGYHHIAMYCYIYLENHPEKVEELVMERVRIAKHVHRHELGTYARIMEYHWLFFEIQVVNTWIHEEEIEKFRGPEGFTHFVSNCAESYRPLDEMLMEEVDKSKQPDPVYIPKHIAHRKRGRR